MKKGQTLAVVTGDIRVLLSGDGTALNYLQLLKRHCNLHAQRGEASGGIEDEAFRYPGKNNAGHAYF